MSLFGRLVRALWIFGKIFASYMTQLGLVELFEEREYAHGSDRPTYVLPRWLKERRKRLDAKNARRLLTGMLQLRGVYIKLGQILSIMGGFLPRVYSKELEALQDQVPAHPFDDVIATFVRSLGKRPEECFREIDPVPLAAASLGQVHVAYMHDGRKVAVKILYPQIRDVIRVDMQVVRLAMKVYEWFFPVANIERVHESLVDLLDRETNYIHEAQCMERLGGYFVDDPNLLFPRVVHELTTEDILTMTFMEGVKITRLDELDRLGVSRTAVATKLVQAFYKMLFVHRFFHADPHPGNFLVQAGDSPDEPRVVVLDFGAISEVSDELVEGLLDMLQGLFAEDGAKVIKGFYRMGFMAEEGNRPLMERTVMTYFKRLLQLKDRTPGALMRAKPKELEALADPGVEREELRDLMKSFSYPVGWFYVERASVLMFWLCGQIDPDLDTMQVGLPYVMPLLLRRLQEPPPASA